MTPCGITGTICLAGEALIEAFDLALQPGWTCLLGPSGSGKSTLLRLLAGLETGAHFDGTIHAPERIGWMAQSDLMQPRLSVVQNVMLIDTLAGRQPDRSRAEDVLAAVGLAGYGARNPEALSGGQRQRVALARTLMSDAPLILLDEPFSALDPATRAGMQELAADQFAGRTVLLVTHDPSEALRLGQRIFQIREKRLEAVDALQGLPPHDLADPRLASASANLLQSLRQSA